MVRSAQEMATELTPKVGDEDYSFIRDELRAYAMKLHTKDQAPREGQQPAQKIPVKKWTPTLSNYLAFLTDNLAVYEVFEGAVADDPALSAFVGTGLERSPALRQDIAFITDKMTDLDGERLVVPALGEPGRAYVNFLQEIKSDIPRFMCHYYNHYFAHTAGGMMIGKKMSDTLLGGAKLDFYKWEGNVRERLNATKEKIDCMALGWTADERKACVEETANCFKFGGSLNSHLNPPPSSPS